MSEASGPSLWEVMATDPSIPIDRATLHLVIRDQRRPSRALLCPWVRVLSRATVTIIVAGKRICPIRFSAHATMDRLCLWFLRRFVSPTAVTLLIRHFIVETNLLNFCVRNARVPASAVVGLRPVTLSDLGNRAVIEHDLNVYRVLFALGAAGAPVQPRCGDLDFGMLEVARDLTEAGYDVVATAADGAQALRVTGAGRPDVVVLDLQLPDMSGVEVTRGLHAAHPAVRVLVLSASGEQQDVLDAVKAGAVGYLLKSAARPEFLDAVRRTADGDAVFTPGLAALVLGEFRRLSSASAGTGSDAPRLSERETEILRMVATGMSYKQIATRLGLSHRTVQNHVQNTLGKLHLHNRVELVRYAIEHGLTGEL